MPILFADDTCLAFSTPDLTALTEIMRKELQSLSIWFDFNKLTVNPSKSNFLILPSKINVFHKLMFLNNISIPLHRYKILGFNY